MEPDKSNFSSNEAFEEKKGGETQDKEQDKPKTEEELLNELAQMFENMFRLENLKKNKYIMNRTNPYFEIPLRAIYEEISVRSKTQDRNLINKALEKTSSISLINNDYIKFNNSVLRNKILVKGIKKENEEEFKNLIYETHPNKDDIKSIVYDIKFSTITITLGDEELAKTLLHRLFEQKFKESSIDCSFQEENLYISIMQENQNQRQKPFNNYPFANNYGPVMMPNPFYMNMNQVINPFMQFNQNQPYRGGGGGGYFQDRKPYIRGPGGDIGGNRPSYNKFRPNYESGGQQIQSQTGDSGGGAPYRKPFRKFGNKRGGGPGSYINKNNNNGRFNNNNNNRYGGGKFNSTQKEDVVDDMTNFPPLADS